MKVILVISYIVVLYFVRSVWSPVKMMTVVSGSMEPVIGVGSNVFVIKSDSYEVNDVITYMLGDYFVTHRIVYSDDYFLTKGDANTLIDPQPVRANQIVGKVLFSMPRNTLLFVILGPAVMIIIYEFYMIYLQLN